MTLANIQKRIKVIEENYQLFANKKALFRYSIMKRKIKCEAKARSNFLQDFSGLPIGSDV